MKFPHVGYLCIVYQDLVEFALGSLEMFFYNQKVNVYFSNLNMTKIIASALSALSTFLSIFERWILFVYITCCSLEIS